MIFFFKTYTLQSRHFMHGENTEIHLPITDLCCFFPNCDHLYSLNATSTTISSLLLLLHDFSTLPSSITALVLSAYTNISK